ncbi:MAG: ATP-grasp domain-containing protein [Hyphomicrobium sp.]|jgi:succinyl-CoA synthetase beta subunit
MKLHEFQAKQILSDFGLLAPESGVAITPEQAQEIARGLKASRFVVKAQIHDHFRNKLTEEHFANSPVEVGKTARSLLGQAIAGNTPGAGDQAIKRVLVEAAVSAEHVFVLSLFVDPAAGGIMLSGYNRSDPAKSGAAGVLRLDLGTGHDFPEQDVEHLVAHLGVPDPQRETFSALARGLVRAFVELDASQIDIDPLAILPDGSLLALGAQLTLDDNALVRQPALLALRCEDELEINAQHHQLNYVRLDGDIGLAANGAGLGLATLDMVRAANGRPANFMDIRTTATSLDIAHGFGLILNNPNVRSLLVNVHGGGMQPCDTIAEGLGIAIRRTGRTLPTVVRLAGNNAAFARTRFENFGCRIIDCPDMWSAAKQAVAAAR